MEGPIKTLTTFAVAKRGASSIEYAVIACLLSLLLIGGASIIGVKLSSHYFTPVAANLS